MIHVRRRPTGDEAQSPGRPPLDSLTTEWRTTMKVSKLAAAVAMGLTFGFGQVALAQKPMDDVKKGDKRTISKEEAMRKFGEKYDAQAAKGKKGILTQDEFRKLLRDMEAGYAVNP